MSGRDGQAVLMFFIVNLNILEIDLLLLLVNMLGCHKDKQNIDLITMGKNTGAALSHVT